MKEKRSKKYELILPTDLDRIQEVEDFTDKIAKEGHFSEEERDSLAIAVTETVNNAMIHGNKNDQNKKVYLEYELTAGQLTIGIKDEGCGFDPTEIADPRDPENLLKERGRGIFIVKTLMNEVTFEHDGSGMLTTLVKKRKTS
jgi:serine/threonine-protein kinase RsbW